MTASAGSAQSPGGGGGNGPGGGGGNAGGFAYTPWGPDDPPVPNQYEALAASVGRPPHCGDLVAVSPGGPFWATALAVCQAITGTGPWPAEAVVPPPPAPENAYQACLNSELEDMLGRALRWHAQHPGAQPQVEYAASSSTSPCQNRIYGVEVLGPENSDSGQVPQAEVPLAVLVGGIEDASADAVVTVDGAPTQDTSDYSVESPGDGMTALFVLTARPPEARTATVALHLHGRTTTASVDLPGPQGSGAEKLARPPDATTAPRPGATPTPSGTGTPGSVPPSPSATASTETARSQPGTPSSAIRLEPKRTQPATGEPTR